MTRILMSFPYALCSAGWLGLLRSCLVSVGDNDRVALCGGDCYRVLLLRSWEDCFIAFRVIGWINLLLLGFLMDNSLFSVVLVTFRLLVSCSHFYLALIVS